MKKLSFLLILFLMTSIEASSLKRVVLMISLDPEKSRPPLYSKKWNINEKLEKIFKRKFKKEKYQLVTIPFTRQSQLRRELLNPNNHAIFWVGHANSAGEMTSNGLYDHKGFNLKEIFQEVHQNIKFLGLIGCRALPYVNALKEKGFWKLNSHLVTYAKDKKVDARIALKRAIRVFKKAKFIQAPKCERQEKIRIHLTRDGSFLGPTRVLRKGKLITTLEENEDQKEIFLSPNLTKAQLKLVLETGAPNSTPKDELGLGTLEFDHPDYQWKLFADRRGNPIGHGSHVYRFNGNLNIETKTEMILPNQCKTN